MRTLAVVAVLAATACVPEPPVVDDAADACLSEQYAKSPADWRQMAIGDKAADLGYFCGVREGDVGAWLRDRE